MAEPQSREAYLQDATFLDAFDRAAEVTDRGFTFLSNELEETTYTFQELIAEARKRGRHLQRLGLGKGDRLAMVIPESEDFVLTFLAAVSVGVVPVPMYPPLALGKLDSYMESAERIVSTAQAKLLVTTKKVSPILGSLLGRARGLNDIITVDRLREPAPFDGVPVTVAPSDPCFLQFTSGSTSDPKGVVVTHTSLVHNARAIMFDGLDSDGRHDKGVSWLPLYHDMGLIGFVLSPVVAHVPVVFIQTMTFVKRPTVWMDTVSKYKGTITFAPNFAFALASKYAARNKKPGFDVSSLRVVGCGAEPINPGTMRRFVDAFQDAGLEPNSIMPCYGMAEATLAMSFDTLKAPFSTVTIDRERYENDHRAVRAAASEGSATVELVSCGRTFPRHRLAVVDADDNLLPEGSVGEIVFQGPSVADGYHDNPEASRAAIRNGWLHTGDLGFILDGEVFISGRMKDLIILNGRNYHPQAIEWEVEQIDGIRKGNVVAFAVRGEDTERLIICAEARRDAAETVVQAVKDAVKNALGLSVHDVLLVPPGGLPKTSSGKLQRRKTRSGYEAGTLGRENRTLGSNATRATVARHITRSVVARLRHRVARMGTFLRSPLAFARRARDFGRSNGR